MRLLVWLARVAATPLLALALLLPMLGLFGLPGRTDTRPELLLDLPPGGGLSLLMYLGVAGAASLLALLAWRGRPQPQILLGIAALVLGFANGLVALLTSQGTWAHLNARPALNPGAAQVLVLRTEARTSTFKGTRSTSHWVSLSHPLHPGASLSLRQADVPSALRQTGLVACVTISTGWLGWRQASLPAPCPSQAAPLALGGAQVLQARLLDQVLQFRHLASGSPVFELDGQFDSNDHPWWLRASAGVSQLAPAFGQPGPDGLRGCGRMSPARFSTDTQTVVTAMNFSAPGQPVPALPPHWEALGRNVTVVDWRTQSHCATVTSLLQPGWVLDGDYHADLKQLAVLSATLAPEPGTRAGARPRKPALDHRVSVYQVDEQGQARLLREQVLAPREPFQPDLVSLQWRGQQVVLQDRFLAHRHVAVFGETPKAAPTPPPSTALPATAPLPPALRALPSDGWRRVAQAGAAPWALYSHESFGGGLLLDTRKSQWHLLTAVQPPTGNDEWQRAPFGFNRVQARMSSTGRQLIACEAAALFTPARCLLLALPV